MRIVPDVRIEKTEQDGIILLKVSDRVELSYLAKLKATFQECAATDSSKVSLNLAGVRSIDSSGVSAIVSFQKELEKKNGKLVLVCVSPNCKYVLELLKLLEYFSIYDSEEEALRILQSYE